MITQIKKNNPGYRKVMVFSDGGDSFKNTTIDKMGGCKFMYSNEENMLMINNLKEMPRRR